MTPASRSLFQTHPKAMDVPATLILASILLLCGLSMPIITFKELVFWKHTFSVLSGIQSLWTENEIVLAVIIFVFSIIFPIIKLAALLLIWFLKISDEKRKAFIHFVGLLGKWSMLDVFVVAITIVITKFSHAVNAKPESGIYFFSASIILSILASSRTESFIKRA